MRHLSATESSLIDFLAQGKPIPGAMIGLDEDLRLPVFPKNKIEVVMEDVQGSKIRFIKAMSRSEGWAVSIRRRSINESDAETISLCVSRLQGRHPSHKIRGWLVSTEMVSKKIQDILKTKGILITTGVSPT